MIYTISKKIYFNLIFIPLITLISNGLVVGELSGMTDSTKIGIENDTTLQSNKLNYIETRFCNDGIDSDKLSMNLSLTAKAGEEKEICIIFFNEGEQDIEARGRFPDNAIEPNGNTNCSTNYGWDNPFSKFIKPTEDIINVPAMGYKIVKTTVKFPIGINGIQKGCYAFGVVGAERAAGMFTFVTRKIRYINILVEGDSNIENKIEISKFTSKLDENKELGILFNVENKGSTDEIIDINGSFSSIFGYKKTFSMSGIVGVNNNKTFNTKDFLVDFEIPRYKGPFKTELNISYKPYFDFDVSKYGFDSTKLEGGTITETKTIFIFPTIPVVLLIVFLVLVYLAFFKKPKIIVQQIETQQKL